MSLKKKQTSIDLDGHTGLHEGVQYVCIGVCACTSYIKSVSILSCICGKVGAIK